MTSAQGKEKGFSLIELIIAVAIVGVLASIAYPSYENYLVRSRRAEAQQFMVEVANRQAQYLLDARNYAVGADALTALNLTAPTNVATYYTTALETSSGGTSPSTPPTFRVRLTPKSGTKQSGDGELILTHDGTKTRGGSPGW